MIHTRRLSARALFTWLERHPVLLPVLILIVGAAFRFFNLNWDDGHQLHPDERGIYMLVTGSNGHAPIGWPASFSQFLDVNSSPLNPHYFAYGSLPYYLLALLAGVSGFLGGHVPFLTSWAAWDTYYGMPTLGRSLSAVLDLSGCVILFLIARRMFDYWTAVLTLALSTLTVFDIQISHFYQVDSLLLPLVLAVLLASVTIAQTNSRSAYIWGGIALGAALASKTTGILLVVPLGLAAVLVGWQSAPWPAGGPLMERLRTHFGAVSARLNANLVWLFAAYAIAAFVFAVCDPYAILNRSQLVTDIQAQQTFLVTNDPPFVVPFTIQYAHTTPYLYQLKNLLFWYLGIPLGFAAFAGTAFYLVRNAFSRSRRDQAVVLIWIIAYFLFVGRFFAKFDRYMLPVTPLMILFGSGLLVWLLRRSSTTIRLVSGTAVTGVILGSFLYALAYMNIYEHANTRVAASNWIFAHIPAGQTVAVEGPWDDPLPLDVSGHTGGQYQHMNLDMYALPDDQNKIKSIAHVLMHAHYIVMSSERMDRSIPRLPDRYPVSVRYYDLLLANKLNFHLVQHFEQHPQLGPIIVQDYAADESFHVYDHPDVRIYKRVANITTARVTALLSAGLRAGSTPAVAASAPDTRLMLTKKQWASDQRGATMDTMFPPRGFAMQHPILSWLFALEIFGLLAFPLTFTIFSNLRDRGFVLGKTVGLLIVGYIVWIAVRTGAATYERGVILLTTLVFGVTSAAFALARRRVIAAFVRTGWRTMLAGEVVFLAGFALFVLLRMWYPDLGHQFSPVSPTNVGQGRMGEKQMELAFLNAIVRSRVLPPFDPFFAHGYINYYYYGFFLVGTLCKLTEIVPATGFNLAIATFFGLLVANVFSVVLTLTHRRGTALIGAAFVGLVGNLNGGWQLVRGLMGVATVHSAVPLLGGLVNIVNGLWRVLIERQPLPPFDYWEPTRIVPPVGRPITEFPYFTYLFADLHPHLIAYPMTVAVLALAVNFVAAGRDRTAVGSAHVVVGALLLGAIAVTNPWDFPAYLLALFIGAFIAAYAATRRLTAQLVAMVMLKISSTAALSVLLYLPFKQDYQTVFSSGLGLVRDVTPQQLINDNVCAGQSGSCASAVHDALQTPLHIYLEHFGLFAFILLSYLLFLLGFRAGVLARLARLRTVLQFAWYYRDRFFHVRHAVAVASRLRRTPSPGLDVSLLAGFSILCLGLLAIQDYLLAFLICMIGLVVLILQRLQRSLPAMEIFTLGVLLVPLILSVATQIFFVKDFLSQGSAFRMNTIFKFYNQAWVLYAICSAVGLDQLYRHRQNRGRDPGPISRTFHRRVEASEPPPFLPGTSAPYAFAPSIPSGSHSADPPERDINVVAFRAGAVSAPGSRLHATDVRAKGGVSRLSLNLWPAWAAGLGLLIVASLIYPYAGTVSRETYRSTWIPENSVPFTLDGMAFMKVAYPGEYRAISWLNTHVAGAQVVVEAANPWYDWRSRVSVFTGLPTIVNGMHENVEQRYSDELDPSSLCAAASSPGACGPGLRPRADDVSTLYSTTSTADAWHIIRHYGVRYIYVGFSERQCTTGQCFPRAGLAKFNRMVGHGLHVAYNRDGVTIYSVVAA